MVEFKYEAKKRSGEMVKGSVSADTVEQANKKLKDQGLVPISVKKDPLKIELQFGGKVTTKDLKTFTRQFATMIDAGLPLVQCLEILGTQCENPWFGKKLMEVKGYVESGLTFSESLAKFPKIFDALFVALIAAGELGGILDTIMRRLAEYIEKKERLQKRVKSAMMYPTTILVITIAILVVLLKWVIPTFEKMFADFGGANALPAPTQFVINLSRGFVDNFLFIIIGFVIFVVAFIAFKRSRAGTEFLHKMYLVLPIVGPVLKKIAVARFTRTLGTLLSSGVPILEALNTVGKAAGNVVIERAIMFARERISEGRNMSDPLREAKIFPGMVVQMIAVGEQTGALDTMCVKIADFYDEEVDVAVAGLTSMLEPLMMVVIGGICGGMVIAMYLPVFTMADTVKK